MTVLEWLNRFWYVSGTPLSALWGHPIRFASTSTIFYWFENFLQQPVPTSPQQIALIIVLSIYQSIYLFASIWKILYCLGGFCLFVFISQIKVTGCSLICTMLICFHNEFNNEFSGAFLCLADTFVYPSSSDL